MEGLNTDFKVFAVAKIPNCKGFLLSIRHTQTTFPTHHFFDMNRLSVFEGPLYEKRTRALATSKYIYAQH